MTNFSALVIRCAMVGMFFIALDAWAQPVSQFQQLQSKVAELQRIRNVQPELLPIDDCSHVPVQALRDASEGRGLSQWIYNGMYQWVWADLPQGHCLYMRSPEDRGLTAAEASSLLAASRMEFPIPEPPKPAGDSVKHRIPLHDNMPQVDLSNGQGTPQ